MPLLFRQSSRRQVPGVRGVLINSTELPLLGHICMIQSRNRAVTGGGENVVTLLYRPQRPKVGLIIHVVAGSPQKGGQGSARASSVCNDPFAVSGESAPVMAQPADRCLQVHDTGRCLPNIAALSILTGAPPDGRGDHHATAAQGLKQGVLGPPLPSSTRGLHFSWHVPTHGVRHKKWSGLCGKSLDLSAMKVGLGHIEI